MGVRTSRRLDGTEVVCGAQNGQEGARTPETEVSWEAEAEGGTKWQPSPARFLQFSFPKEKRLVAVDHCVVVAVDRRIIECS